MRQVLIGKLPSRLLFGLSSRKGWARCVLPCLGWGWAGLVCAMWASDLSFHSCSCPLGSGRRWWSGTVRLGTVVPAQFRATVVPGRSAVCSVALPQPRPQGMFGCICMCLCAWLAALCVFSCQECIGECRAPVLLRSCHCCPAPVPAACWGQLTGVYFAQQHSAHTQHFVCVFHAPLLEEGMCVSHTPACRWCAQLPLRVICWLLVATCVHCCIPATLLPCRDKSFVLLCPAAELFQLSSV